MTANGRYVHATAVIVRESGVLIRGPSGAGKSHLALALIAEAERRTCFARLVGDDRVALTACNGRLLARGHPRIAGLIERRGEGIIRVPYEAVCAIDWVVDLSPESPVRLPAEPEPGVALEGVNLPRIVVPARSLDCDISPLFERLSRSPSPRRDELHA